MYIVYFLMPIGETPTRKYSDTVCKALLRYSSVIYEAICEPQLFEPYLALEIKARIEPELEELKRRVDPDDTYLVSLIEDYISVCNEYPDAIVYSEYDK